MDELDAYLTGHRLAGAHRSTTRAVTAGRDDALRRHRHTGNRHWALYAAYAQGVLDARTVATPGGKPGQTKGTHDHQQSPTGT